MKKWKRMLAVVLSMAMICTTINISVRAEDSSVETGVNNAEDVYTGSAGDLYTDYWIFEPDTATLTFYGENAHYYRCDEFAEQVKHVVFTKTVTNTKWSSEESEFPNLEDVYISENMSDYSSAMFMSSTKIKEYIVDEKNINYYAVDGNLYRKNDCSLQRYAVGKTDSTFIVDKNTKIVLHTAFYGNSNLKKIILPESVTTINLPLSDEKSINDIEVYNPNCKISYSYNREENENLTIYSYTNANIKGQCEKYQINFADFTYENIKSVSIAKYPATSIIRGWVYNGYDMTLNVEFTDGDTAELLYGYKLSDVDTYYTGVVPVEVSYGGYKLFYDLEITEIPEEELLKTGFKKSITVPSGKTMMYYFEPEVTGKYRFYTEGNYDTYLELKYSDKSYKKDDDSGAKYNGQIEYYLKAGKVYQIYVDTYETSGKTFNLCADLLKQGENNGIQVAGKVENDYLDNFENLKITYTATGIEENQPLGYGAEPGLLEKAVNGVWQKVPVLEDAFWPEEVYFLYTTETLSVPLKYYYGELATGEYRYTHKIGDDTVSVKFNIFNMADKEEKYILKEGTTPVTIGWYRTLYFKAERTGDYRIYTTGDCDTYGMLISMNENVIRSNDDSGSGYNFSMIEELEAGQKYILEIYNFSSYASDFNIVVEGPCEHQYESVVLEATCTHDGYTTYTCIKCGDSYKDNQVENLDHQLGDYINTATCINPGETYRWCTRCEKKINIYKSLPLGHNYEKFVIEPVGAEWGYTLHACSRCDYEYKTNWKEPEIKAEEETTTEIIETTSAVVEKNNIVTKINNIIGAKKSLTITWKKKIGVSGYQIQISTNKKFKQRIAKNVGRLKGKVKFNKLKAKKRYYVRVRTYIAKNGKKIYSKWSKVKSKRTK